LLPVGVERKISLSNIRSLPLTDKAVVIGDHTHDREAEEQADVILKNTYPEIDVLITYDGKKQIPLQQFLVLEERFQREKTAAYNKGLEEGRKEGRQNGLEEGRREAREVVTSLSGILKDITQQRQTILSEAKDKILELVLKISQKLTFDAAAANPELTLSIISGAIDQLLDKSKIKIKVNPDHLPEVKRHIDRFLGRETTIKEFAIEGDPRIRKGGCFIETPSGDIDARLESMYDVISQVMLDPEGAKV